MLTWGFHRGQRFVTLVLVIVAVASSLALIALIQRPTGPAISEPEIRITYSPSYTNTIAGNFRPEPGRKFLVVGLTVENSGYPNFTANPFRDMYVEIEGRKYNVSATYFLLDNYFVPADILNGEFKAGNVVFEVPEGTTSFNPHWRLNTPISLHWNKA